MKMLRHFFAASVAGLCLAALPGLAQTGTLNTATKPTVGRVLSPEIPPSPSAADANAVKRPDRPERALPPEIKAQLQKFEAAREAYLKQQEELRRKEQSSTDEERKIIRQRIQESHDAWVERAKQYRDEARERVKEIKRELAPKFDRALDDNRNGPRRRPGVD